MKKYFILLAFIVTWKIKTLNHDIFWSESSMNFSSIIEATDFVANLFSNPDVVEVKIKQVKDK